MDAGTDEGVEDEGVDGGEADGGEAEDGDVRVWLVERTYGDDELNMVILTYATLDGEQYYRKERALTSFTGPARETTAAVEVDPGDLGRTPAEDREYYANAAGRTAERYAPDEGI